MPVDDNRETQDSELASLRAALEDQTRRRRAAEDACRALEDRFHAVFHDSPSAMSLVSVRDQRYREVNATFETQTGYSRAEVIGRTPAEVGIWVDEAARRLLGRELRGGGSVRGLEVRLRAKSGVVHAVALSARVVEYGGEPCSLVLAEEIGERKAAEEALRASEERFRTLVGNLPGAVYRCAPRAPWRMEHLSEAVHAICGHPARAFLGSPPERDWGDLVAPEDLPRVATLSGRPPYVDEYRVRHADGSLRWVRDRGVAVLDAAGEVLWLDGVITDITAEKAAEQALRESEERYRSLFEAASDAILLLDAENGRILDANPAATPMYGYTREELLGLRYLDLSAEPEQTAEALRSGLGRAAFRRHRRKDGSVFPVDITASYYEQGGRRLSVVSIRDISERERAQEALRESEERYRLLFEGAIDGIALADVESGILLACNPALAELVGRRPEELIGRHQSVLHPSTEPRGERHTESFERRLTGWAGRLNAAQVTRPNGEVLDVEIKGSPVQLAGRTLMLGIFRDVTDRKRAEAHRRDLEARLQQSQRLESLGVLAGGIAHDFNNILAAIMGFAELTIRQCIPGTEAEGNLRQVLHGTERARDLVKQILAFSRQGGSDPQPIHLGPLLTEALRLVRASLPAQIEIDLRVAPDLWIALADPSQIHQVVLNLCANAEYAMRAAGGLLTVSLANESLDAERAAGVGGIAPGRYVVLAVADTGVGIAEPHRSRVFDPFFTTKPQGEGTGLGLATSHGIVVSHGGAITVASAPGQGATFTIYLPAAPEGAGARVERSAEPRAPMGRGCVLFVDDEPALAAMAEPLLAALGYESVALCDPTEALERIRREPGRFRAVITDQSMPHLLGTSLAEAIRELAPDLPIILASGYASRIDWDQARALGVREILDKPFKLRELAEVLERAIGGGPDGQRGSPAPA